jgi:hypothetical protein
MLDLLITSLINAWGDSTRLPRKDGLAKLFEKANGANNPGTFSTFSA